MLEQPIIGKNSKRLFFLFSLCLGQRDDGEMFSSRANLGQT